MSPPNIPLPPTPLTHLAPITPAYGQQRPPDAFTYSTADAAGGDIYEHLPGESSSPSSPSHHMYDMTYEDSQTVRRNSWSPTPTTPTMPSSHTAPHPTFQPESSTVTVNGFALAC